MARLKLKCEATMPKARPRAGFVSVGNPDSGRFTAFPPTGRPVVGLIGRLGENGGLPPIVPSVGVPGGAGGIVGSWTPDAGLTGCAKPWPMRVFRPD